MVTRAKKPAAGKSGDRATGTGGSYMSGSRSASSAAHIPGGKHHLEEDNGNDIGEIMEEAAPVAGFSAATKASSSESARAGASHKRSIGSFPHYGSSSAHEDDTVPPAGRNRNAWLVVVMLICLAVATAGVTVFMRNVGFGWSKAGLVPVGQKADEYVSGLPATVNAEVLISVNPIEGETRPVLATRMIETDVSAEAEFPTTGISAGLPGKSQGKAKIVNTTAKTFNFVATTRLLSEGGVLFRLKSPASIQANGETEVEVIADQPGDSGDIGPAQFTIPGLPAALQKEVYARSSSSMAGGAASSKGVTEEDIAKAKLALTEQLKADAETKLKALANSGESVSSDLVTSSEIEVEAPAAGTPGDTIKMTLTLRFKALLVPSDAIKPLLSAALLAAAPAGEAESYGFGDALYVVQAYPQPDRAELRVEAPIFKK